MKRYFSLLIPAILCGLILTGLWAMQVKDFRPAKDCFTYQNETLSSVIETSRCSGQEYGFPQPFLYVEPTASATSAGNNFENVVIGVGGVIRLDKLALLLNAALWTGLSYIVLLAVAVSVAKLSKPN